MNTLLFRCFDCKRNIASDNPFRLPDLLLLKENPRNSKIVARQETVLCRDCVRKIDDEMFFSFEGPRP